MGCACCDPPPRRFAFPRSVEALHCHLSALSANGFLPSSPPHSTYDSPHAPHSSLVFDAPAGPARPDGRRHGDRISANGTNGADGSSRPSTCRCQPQRPRRGRAASRRLQRAPRQPRLLGLRYLPFSRAGHASGSGAARPHGQRSAARSGHAVRQRAGRARYQTPHRLMERRPKCVCFPPVQRLFESFAGLWRPLCSGASVPRLFLFFKSP